MSEWIKTSERMPKHGQDVAYINIYKYVCVGKMFATNVGDCFDTRSSNDGPFAADTVLYWTELPELPKEIK